MRRKADRYKETMQFVVQRINEINEWRFEALKNAHTKDQVASIEARALALREAAEGGGK